MEGLGLWLGLGLVVAEPDGRGLQAREKTVANYPAHRECE